jgi:hypothetical protein
MTINNIKNSKLAAALFKCKDGKFVIFQYPNLPLWVAILAYALRLFLKIQPIYNILDWVFNISILVWAILEILWGVNLFRKIFGGVVFALIIAGLIFG